MSKKLRKNGAKSKVYNIPERIKMSEVLKEYAVPLLKEVKEGDIGGFEFAIVFAIACWNMSLMPKDEQENAIKAIVDDLIRQQKYEDIELTIEMIDMMIIRKKLFFSSYENIIVGYTLHPIEGSDGAFILNVLSLTRSK